MEVCEKDLFFILPAEVYARRTNVTVVVTRAVQTFNPIHQLNADVEHGGLIHGRRLAENQCSETWSQMRRKHF